jgi:SP family galactose:H+ symporter-like MFS transporter
VHTALCVREAQLKLRYEEEVEDEITELSKEVAEEKELGVASWHEIFSTDNKMRYRLFLGISVQAIQQLSGINAILFYAPEILETFFSEEAAVYGTFVLNVINFFAILLSLS